jgi:cytochrome c556
MKRAAILVCATVFLVTALGTANAELKLIGTGADMKADISSFPANLKSTYPLFEKKCNKCHGMDRTLLTLQSGMAPSGSPFDSAAIDAYGAKMLRKADADMTKQDVKSINELMRYMLDEAAK